jgi:hypothetical protein
MNHVYIARTDVPGHAVMVRDLLELRGPGAVIAASPDLGDATGPAVWVADEDGENAWNLVSELTRRKVVMQSDRSRQCRYCDETVDEDLGACWGCGRRRMT